MIPVWGPFPEHWGEPPPMRYGTPYLSGDTARRAAWIGECEAFDARTQQAMRTALAATEPRSPLRAYRDLLRRLPCP